VSLPTRPPRVLLGDLEPMTRVGMRKWLAEGGVEVVGEVDEPAAIVAESRRLAPDAVVLALGDGAGRMLGKQVRGAAPTVTVILWARDETEMEVLEPGTAPPRRVATGVPDALLRELTSVSTTRERV
jgi:DNA-binding NarL/FixJ family response regulator